LRDSNLRTRAEVPTTEILSVITEAGWRVEAIEESDSWRVRIIWHLQSAWSPLECEAFLLFLVDPQDDGLNRKIFAVAASANRSFDSTGSQDQNILYFAKGWPKQLTQFVRALNLLRSARSMGPNRLLLDGGEST
jgi:hypothetical protein